MTTTRRAAAGAAVERKVNKVEVADEQSDDEWATQNAPASMAEVKVVNGGSRTLDWHSIELQEQFIEVDRSKDREQNQAEARSQSTGLASTRQRLIPLRAASEAAE
jgi:hypothetical protein